MLPAACPAFALDSHPAPRGFFISGVPAPPFSIGPSPAKPGEPSSCGSRTPTSSARPGNPKRPCSRVSNGWASSWDEGPYRQSERAGRHREVVESLLAGGGAYRCICTREELEARRTADIAAGGKGNYDGRCRDARARTGLWPAHGAAARRPRATRSAGTTWCSDRADRKPRRSATESSAAATALPFTTSPSSSTTSTWASPTSSAAPTTTAIHPSRSRSTGRSARRSRLSPMCP